MESAGRSDIGHRTSRPLPATTMSDAEMIPTEMEEEEGVEGMEIEVTEEEEVQERGSWEGSDVTIEEI